MIEGVEPWGPRLRIIDHSRNDAFVLFALPGWAGEAADCRRMIAREGTMADEGEDKSSARHFVSALQIETVAGEPAVLYLGWEKENDAWRIFALKVVDP